MESEKSRTELIAEHINDRVPLVAVGGIRTPEEAVRVLEQGNADFVALGRALVVDPNWIEKVMLQMEHIISRHVTPEDQQKATIPTPLWNQILAVEGWFPVER